MQARPAVPNRQRGGISLNPLLLVGLVILTLYFARDLVVPLAFALVLNFLLSPAVAWLERRRLGRAPAVVLVILVFFSALGTTGWVVARQVVHVAEMLPDYRENIQAKIDSLHTPIGGAAGKHMRSLEEMSQQLSKGETLNTPTRDAGAHTTRRRRSRLSSAPSSATTDKAAIPQ